MAISEKLERVAFGTFEVDLQAGELWKAGFRVRLSGQPFKVLAALLERHGEVVTRDELQVQIWGSNTNVDFERAISGTINKIREALGDSAESPRFIETLTKRGYRFIAPVTVINVVRGELTRTPSTGEKSGSTSAQDHEFDHSLAVGNPSSFGTFEPASIKEPGTNFIAPADFHSGSGPEIAHSTLPKLGIRIRNSTVRERISFSLNILLLIGLLSAYFLRRPDETPPHIVQVTHGVPLSMGPPNAESFLTLAQDGDRILTSVLMNGRSRLSAIVSSTGEVQSLTMPDEIGTSTLADISKDGSNLLLRSNGSSESEQPLWIVPSSGGSGQRVGNVLAHDATWMPDGLNILYANENELIVFRQDDAASTPLVKLPGRAFWLRWSPDGNVLRFTLMNPVTHATSLWEWHNGRKEPEPVPKLEPADSSSCCGVWIADGSAYVYQANDNLWELRGSGIRSRVFQLTNGPLRFLSPVAARSGGHIFFVGLEQPSGLQQFVEKQRDFESAPAFLADANRVEYSCDGNWVAWTDVYEKLWRARSDGSDKIRLTSDAIEVFAAHWSPDGHRLALMAREHGGIWQTYLVDAAGGKPEALIKETRNAADPSWSADGLSLVYGREPDLMGKEAGPRNLQIVNLSTHQTETIPDSEGLFSPRWSPDGRWIVALSLDQKRLMLFNTTQRRWQQLVSTSAADPVWSKDSKAVYVHAFLADGEPILRVSVPDGSMRTVADLTNFHDRGAANYFFSGLTLADAPLVRPRIGTGDLYSLDLQP